MLLGGVVLDGCEQLFEVLTRHCFDCFLNDMRTVWLLAEDGQILDYVLVEVDYVGVGLGGAACSMASIMIEDSLDYKVTELIID